MTLVAYVAVRFFLSLVASAFIAGYVMLVGVRAGIFAAWWAPGRFIVMLLNAIGITSPLRVVPKQSGAGTSNNPTSR